MSDRNLPTTNTSVLALAQQAGELKQANQLAAADVYQQALALDDTVAEIWFNYGNLLHRLRKTPFPVAYLLNDC